MVNDTRRPYVRIIVALGVFQPHARTAYVLSMCVVCTHYTWYTYRAHSCSIDHTYTHVSHARCKYIAYIYPCASFRLIPYLMLSICGNGGSIWQQLFSIHIQHIRVRFEKRLQVVRVFFSFFCLPISYWSDDWFKLAGAQKPDRRTRKFHWLALHVCLYYICYMLSFSCSWYIDFEISNSNG